MDNQLLNGIGSYLMLGRDKDLTTPYLSGMYFSTPYLSSSYLAGEGAAGVFQSGVRFGQALEKAMEKNPEKAEDLQAILKEVFESQSGSKTASGKSCASVKNGAWSSRAAVYEPSSGSRISGTLESYLAGRRTARAQERQAGKNR